MVEDTKERPGDGNASGNIAFPGSECVRSRCGLEEEKGKENEDLGDDTGVVGASINTERLEGGDEDEDGGPAMVETEWDVDPEFVIDALTAIVLLDDVINVGHSGRNKKSKDEGDDEVLAAPNIDVNGIQDGQKRESPADAINDDSLSFVKELEDYVTEQEEVNEGPDAKGPP